MTDPLLELTGIGKRFYVYNQQKTLFRLTKSVLQGRSLRRELWALKNIHMKIFEGDKIGIIGRNGAGKTTLLRILSDILEPTEGKIAGRQYARPLFNYGVGLAPPLPVLDNIYIVGAFHGLLIEEVKRSLETIIRFAELEEFLYLPVKNLSAGQRQRLLFSVFIHTQDPFLAFDESISVADAQFNLKSEAYFDKLMTSNKTLLVATHSLHFISKYCRRVLWLEKGEAIMLAPPSEVIPAYQDFCSKENKSFRSSALPQAADKGSQA